MHPFICLNGCWLATLAALILTASKNGLQETSQAGRSEQQQRPAPASPTAQEGSGLPAAHPVHYSLQPSITSARTPSRSPLAVPSSPNPQQSSLLQPEATFPQPSSQFTEPGFFSQRQGQRRGACAHGSATPSLWELHFGEVTYAQSACRQAALSAAVVRQHTHL